MCGIGEQNAKKNSVISDTISWKGEWLWETLRRKPPKTKINLLSVYTAAGDPGSIPGSGGSAGDGIRYPLQYSCASLVAQLVKNPPAMRETWVWSLGWDLSLEKGQAMHSRILAWRTPGTVWGVAKSQTQLNDFHLQYICSSINNNYSIWVVSVLWKWN